MTRYIVRRSISSNDFSISDGECHGRDVYEPESCETFTGLYNKVGDKIFKSNAIKMGFDLNAK